MSLLIHLALSFALLSILAVGGGTAVLPEMQSLLSHQFGIDHTQFIHIYSFGQLAPGPNMLMVLVIGYQLAGLLGASIVLLSFFLPLQPPSAYGKAAKKMIMMMRPDSLTDRISLS